MNSEVPKWMPLESAVRFPNRSEEASANRTEEEEGGEEMGRCKRSCTTLDREEGVEEFSRTTLDSEEGVEEFLVLLDRIEEMKKDLKRKRRNCSVNGISGGGSINAVEEDQILTAMPGMQHGLPDAVDMIACNKSRTSPWKPSFEWEDFNTSNSLCAKTDLSCAAATEKGKHEEGSFQIGHGLLQTIQFLDGDKPAECLQDHVDDVNKEEVDAPPDLELQLFPI